MPGEAHKIPQPRQHRAKVCIWDDLTVHQMDVISKTDSNEDIKGILCEIFGLDDYSQNPRSAILVDLYFFTIQYARENGFSKEQTAAFFSIVRKTHEMMIESPFGNVELCYGYFKELVLCHAVKRPPWSVDLFMPDQVKLITEYVVNTYFKHHKLYKYVFTPLVRLDLAITYEGVPETPPPSEAEDETKEETEAEDVIDGDTTKDEDELKTPEPELEKEESPKMKELRKIIQQHLSEEVEKLRISVDNQIQKSEETIQTKLTSVDGSGQAKRASSRTKKGK
ncbi:cilia- and flagella-associated protein 119-like [Saccoglossus kowalevskii]|uniref:Coiled-coil domain-containing protein C16orf93-like n=1 Tax=Saccoglossus kowalevskii TaxID=10224 RepID=A0ABM0GJP4_SACKO|nr:PREDICTED: coiled-coil domain-containing protein C16orf93-like [Saccoglossus kowalevskii]